MTSWREFVIRGPWGWVRLWIRWRFREPINFRTGLSVSQTWPARMRVMAR